MITSEIDQATEHILIPETRPEKPQFTLGEHTFFLRPLPIKHAKILSAKVKPFESYVQQDGVTALDALSQVSDVFIESATHLLTFYGVEGLSKDWIEENCTFDDVRELIAAQMALQKREDFLLLPLRLLCERMAAAAQTTGALPEPQLPSPSPPST